MVLNGIGQLSGLQIHEQKANLPLKIGPVLFLLLIRTLMDLGIGSIPAADQNNTLSPSGGFLRRCLYTGLDYDS